MLLHLCSVAFLRFQQCLRICDRPTIVRLCSSSNPQHCVTKELFSMDFKDARNLRSGSERIGGFQDTHHRSQKEKPVRQLVDCCFLNVFVDS